MDKQLQKEEFSDNSMVFQFGVNDFSAYQKQCPQNYKSRAQKRKERVQKLTKYLHDPEQKKAKKQEQRKVQKEKLHQVIDKMTKEEARTYLDSIKNNKAQLKKKVREAMSSGQVFMIDMVYEQQMNEKENRSLAKQVELIMKVIKHFEHPPSIHLCSVQGQVQQQLTKMGVQYWAVTPHHEDILQIAQTLGKKAVYLSPDASLDLESIESDTAYILGGLVDRTILKNASVRRAEQLGIEARKLPIAQFMKGRLCLNLDHVINMICKFVQCKDWKVAFDFAAPKRWKKEQTEPEKQQQKDLNKVEVEKAKTEEISQSLEKMKISGLQQELIQKEKAHQVIL